eukprot:1199126-Pyramimonas_sp.AAC.1
MLSLPGASSTPSRCKLGHPESGPRLSPSAAPSISSSIVTSAGHTPMLIWSSAIDCMKPSTTRGAQSSASLETVFEHCKEHGWSSASLAMKSVRL